MGYLIENIECSDAALQAAIAKIRTDSDGARQDFEQAIAELLPVDPYLKNKANTKSVTFAISNVEGKPGRGAKTGVDLRWYDPSEWKTLSFEEQKELVEWRKTKEGKAATKDQADQLSKSNKRKKNREKNGSRNKKFKARIAALEKELGDKKEVEEQEKKVSLSRSIFWHSELILALTREGVNGGRMAQERPLESMTNI